jgi:hypothetical protein
VLLVWKEEQDDSESLDGDFEGLEEPILKVSPLTRPRGPSKFDRNTIL